MATKTEIKQIAELLDLHADKLSRVSSPFQDTSKQAVKERHEKTKANPEEFKQLYLPHYVDSLSAEFHADLDAMMNYPEKALFLVHGPREHAKSVECRINVMEGTLNGRIQYWIFGAEKVSRAWSHIDYIHMDMMDNPRIQADYDIKVLKYDSINGIYRARVTCKATGKRNMFQFEAVSDDTSGKGMTFLNMRPQGALVDDLEKTKDTYNPQNGKKKVDWVVQELYGAITGPLVWLGNMGRKTSALHQGFEEIYENEEDFKEFKKNGSVPGLFAKICKRNGGKLPTSDGLRVRRGFIFKAERVVNGKTVYLWSERYNPRWYNSERAAMKYRYEGEMNGNPIAPGKVFKNFPRYKPEDLKAFENGEREFTVFTWLDPAWGRSKSSAYKCWFVMLYDGSHFYILDCYCRQGSHMSEVIDHWNDAFQKWAYLGLRDGGYEDAYDQENRFEEDLEVMEAELGVHLPVRSYKNPGEKHSRIDSMQVDFDKERMLFPANLSDDFSTAKDQLENYPDHPYVDAPDALEACRTKIRTRLKRSKVNYKSISKRRYNRSRR